MEYFSNKEVNELFLDYLEMRQEKWKKFKATNISIKRAINLLNKYDDKTKIKMLDISIINNRTWIWPIKWLAEEKSEAFIHKYETNKKIYEKDIIWDQTDEQKLKNKEILQKARNLFRNIDDV